MLGNDVVDLQDPESRPETFRPRFDERVFTPEERRSIARDADPLARRWAHWAAKEATYKLLKQADGDVVFSPGAWSIEFEPRPLSPSPQRRLRGSVRFDAGEPDVLAGVLAPIEIQTLETDAAVHALARPGGADWDAVDFAIERIDPQTTDPSEAVRALAVRGIARSLGVDAARLSITRSSAIGDERRRIPTVELDGEATNVALSLSHHGRFVAYAMTPQSDVDLFPVLRPGLRPELVSSVATFGAFLSRASSE